MDGKTVSFYLDENDVMKIEILKKALKIKSNSQFMRYLVNEKYHEYSMYFSDNLSDKQIINCNHSNRFRKKSLLERG